MEYAIIASFPAAWLCKDNEVFILGCQQKKSLAAGIKEGMANNVPVIHYIPVVIMPFP